MWWLCSQSNAFPETSSKTIIMQLSTFLKYFMKSRFSNGHSYIPGIAVPVSQSSGYTILCRIKGY